MPDQDLSLPSGAKHHITLAPFQDANALTKALLKTTVGLRLAENPLEMDLGVLKDVLVAAATSDEVEALMFKCLERSTYEGTKVTRELFDDIKMGEQARGDYYAMCANIIKVDCQPFFEKALSMLKLLLKKKGDSPK